MNMTTVFQMKLNIANPLQLCFILHSVVRVIPKKMFLLVGLPQLNFYEFQNYNIITFLTTLISTEPFKEIVHTLFPMFYIF